MSTTILEELQCAQYNLDNVAKLGMGLMPLVKRQLGGAILLLEKGYSPDDDATELVGKYGSYEAVPEKEDA